MSSNLRSFILHYDFYDKLKLLNEKQQAKLFCAIFEYHKNGVEKTGDAFVDFALCFLIGQFKRDGVKYKDRAERSRQNGKNGGRPRKEDNPENPVGLSKTQTNPDEPRKPDSISIPSPIPSPIPNPIPTVKKKNIKKNFNSDELANKIMLSQEEYDKLISNYGIAIVNVKIDALAGSAKYGTYKSHYSTLNNWAKKSIPAVVAYTDEQREAVEAFTRARDAYTGKKRAAKTEIVEAQHFDSWVDDCFDIEIAVIFMNTYRTGYYKTGFVPSFETFIVKRRWEEVLEDKKVSDKLGF